MFITFKKGDILLSSTNKVLTYLGEINDSKLGVVAKAQIYRTSKIIKIPFSQIIEHPFFCETEKC